MTLKHLWGVVVAGALGCGKPPQAVAPPAAEARSSRSVTVSVADVAPVIPEYHGTLVELRGDGAEMGTRHGEQLGPQIRVLHDTYLARYLGTGARRYVALSAARLFEGYIDPQHLAEIDALGRKAGMDERESVLAQCFLDLTPISACSTVGLPPAAAPDHVARFGRNLDFPSFNIADKYSAVFIVHPKDRYAFAAVGWPGMVGVLSGMNEHGLALANMEVRRGARLPSAMPYTLLYRTVLEKCRTVAEAVALLEATPRQTANNLMLMDAGGDRAVVEITPERVVVRRGADDAALISTNHQRGTDCDSPGRCWRYDSLHDTAGGEFGHIDLAKVESMLAAVSPGKATLQSMVFEPANRVIYLSTGSDATSGRYERINLRRYFPESQLAQKTPPGSGRSAL